MVASPYHGRTFGGGTPDAAQIAGQHLGAADAFADLPRPEAMSDGDIASLRVDDGDHPAGEYRIVGGEYTLMRAYPKGGGGGFVLMHNPTSLSAADFDIGPIEAVMDTRGADKTLTLATDIPDGTRLKVVSEGLCRIIISGALTLTLTGAGSVHFEKVSGVWVPFNPTPAMPKL